MFCYLFPVLIAGTAMIMDFRNAKIDNGWILFSLAVGFTVGFLEKGFAGIRFFLTGSAVPLFLIILFLFGMLGAGDIKLFCALGGVMGTGAVLKCILASFILGAFISVILLMIHRNFCERILYFIRYVDYVVKTGKIISYRRKDISSPENFHFTVPIFISVVLYAGGMF